MKSQFVNVPQSAICNPQFAILLLFAVTLIASWQRWTQPLLDHGREMNLPARILAGERLYSDVQFLYGPFAPHFNALLYHLFGVHLSVLKVSGAVCAVLILLLIYRIARALMSEWESFLAAGLVLVICALKSTANYIQPYAYAALYGLIFALCSLAVTVNYIKRRSELRFKAEAALEPDTLVEADHLKAIVEGPDYLSKRPERLACLAGLFAGLSLISKPEIALTSLAAAFTALIVESLAERRPLWRDATWFILSVSLITAATYGFILSRTSLRVLLEDNHTLFTKMPEQLIYFNRHISGLAQWPSSLWFSLAGIGVFALWAGLCAMIGAALSRREGEWRGVFKIGLIVALIGAAWREAAIRLFGVPSDVTPFASAVFLLPALMGFIIRKWSFRQPRLRILLVIAIFSFVSILRAILNVTTTGPYTPFFIPGLIIVYLYLLFRVAPALMTKSEPVSLNIRRVTMLLIASLIVGMNVNSAKRLHRLNTFTVTSPRGSFITVPEIGEPLQAAIRYVEEQTAPGDYVLALPIATTINFMANRRYPLREEIVHPGFLEGDNELDAIERVKTRDTPLILIANLDTSEFRDRAFGIDYNQRLMRWINENYHIAARFDSANSHDAKFGDKPFFIIAYKRNR
jgi:4-amino-4-deoxy-L-arabinose transferase-like glycosyltransferase